MESRRRYLDRYSDRSYTYDNRGYMRDSSYDDTRHQRRHYDDDYALDDISPDYGDDVAPDYGDDVAPDYCDDVEPDYGDDVAPDHGNKNVPRNDDTPNSSIDDDVELAPAAAETKRTSADGNDVTSADGNDVTPSAADPNNQQSDQVIVDTISDDERDVSTCCWMTCSKQVRDNDAVSTVTSSDSDYGSNGNVSVDVGSVTSLDVARTLRRRVPRMRQPVLRMTSDADAAAAEQGPQMTMKELEAHFKELWKQCRYMYGHIL